jgi:hypothetical protein
MLYATDASIYQVEPRGGGTSLAGQTINRAVVIETILDRRFAFLLSYGPLRSAAVPQRRCKTARLPPVERDSASDQLRTT